MGSCLVFSMGGSSSLQELNFLEAPPISSRSVLCPPQAVDSLMSIPEYESDEATAVSSKAVSDEVASIDGSNDMAMGAV